MSHTRPAFHIIYVVPHIFFQESPMNARFPVFCVLALFCLWPTSDSAQPFGDTGQARKTSTLPTAQPYAYLLPAHLASVVKTLQQQGILVEEIREDLDLDIELQ